MVTVDDIVRIINLYEQYKRKTNVTNRDKLLTYIQDKLDDPNFIKDPDTAKFIKKEIVVKTVEKQVPKYVYVKEKEKKQRDVQPNDNSLDELLNIDTSINNSIISKIISNNKNQGAFTKYTNFNTCSNNFNYHDSDCYDNFSSDFFD